MKSKKYLVSGPVGISTVIEVAKVKNKGTHKYYMAVFLACLTFGFFMIRVLKHCMCEHPSLRHVCIYICMYF